MSLSTRLRPASLVVALCAFVASGAQAELTDEQKCGAKKSNALVKYAKCLDKAYTAFFDDKDPAKEKVAKCHATCVKRMASAEKNGTCEVNDDSANGAICGPDSVMDDDAECRYKATHPIPDCPSWPPAPPT